jgi:hypothetical protein
MEEVKKGSKVRKPPAWKEREASSNGSIWLESRPANRVLRQGIVDASLTAFTSTDTGILHGSPPSSYNRSGRESSVGIAARPRAAQPRRHFSLLRNAQTGSSPMDTGALSVGVTRQRHEADHSAPSSAVVKNGGPILSLPHTSSWRGA